VFGEGIDSPGSWKPPPRKVEKGREEAFAAKQVGKSSAMKLVLAQRQAKSANAKAGLSAEAGEKRKCEK